MPLPELSQSETLFFDLLRSGLWSTLPKEDYSSLIEKDWEAIFGLARKQAVIGNVLDGISKLPKELHPPLKIKLQWIALVQKIEQQNNRLNDYAVEIAEQFRRDGFRNIILKGQGLAIYYPNPLHRQSGDIDIYMEGERNEILRYIQKLGGGDAVSYHHIKYSTPKAEIECHTNCSYFLDPLKNKRVQRKFKKWTEESFDNYVNIGVGEITIPNVELNQFYVLHHIYRHTFGRGIGLRQLCDYAMLMNHTFSTASSEVFRKNMNEFGLTKFAKAVFDILVTYLGYPQEKLPVDINNSKFSPILFTEIMKGGNFGNHNKLVQKINYSNYISRFSFRLKHNLSFFMYFPREVVFTPYFLVWHYFWKKSKNYL